jgi:hypothetical protein
MFEITVDASHLKNIIFIDIDKYIGQNGESKVLFSIGILRVRVRMGEEDTFFILALTLTNPLVNALIVFIKLKFKQIYQNNNRVHVHFFNRNNLYIRAHFTSRSSW